MLLSDLGENTRLSVWNNMSETDCVFIRLVLVTEGGGAESISIMRLKGRINAYNAEMKSLRSRFSASPVISTKRVSRKGDFNGLNLLACLALIEAQKL